MTEVLSLVCSSMIVPQGNPLLALDPSMPTAGHPTHLTRRGFPHSTINVCRRRLAASQAHCC